MSMDMNLVSLIDIFTILLFFLLSSATGVEILTSTKAVKLPESSADKSAQRDSRSSSSPGKTSSSMAARSPR